jgi:hypothetical protein
MVSGVHWPGFSFFYLLQWYWAGDSKEAQDVWVGYDLALNKVIETAYHKGQAKIDVGGGRCVIFGKMVQVRDGDSNRVRAVLRSTEKLVGLNRKTAKGAAQKASGGLVAKPSAAVGLKSIPEKEPVAKTLTGLSAPQVGVPIKDAGPLGGKLGTAAPGQGEDGLPKGKFARAFSRPTGTTLTSVCFSVGDGCGVRMGSKDSWAFEIPKQYHDRNVLTVVLAHRKPSEDSYLMESYINERDQEGAYTLVQVRSPTGKLVSWMDGSLGIKFAEPRPRDDPEEENLHDWLKFRGRIQCTSVVLTGKGVGERGVAHIHKVVVEFEPREGMIVLQERIFNRIDHTGRFDPHSRVVYGGGPDAHGQSLQRIISNGVYPNAVTLGSGKKDVTEDFGGGIRIVKGRLHVTLLVGKVFLMLEIACGDTIFDVAKDAEKKNKDGHYGQLGWAKIYARIANQERFIMCNINVPPNAVLRGGANEPDGHVCLEDEEIVVESKHCATFVMGIRVIYKK